MKSRLVNGLEEGDKDLVTMEFKSTVRLRDRIVELLERDIEGVYASMRDEKSYESGAWPYKQAEKIGEIKAIKKLISLFE